MPTLAFALAAILSQGAFACECDRAVAWVSPHGAIFTIAPAGPREIFITRVGQDDRGYWTMTKEGLS